MLPHELSGCNMQTCDTPCGKPLYRLAKIHIVSYRHLKLHGVAVKVSSDVTSSGGQGLSSSQSRQEGNDGKWLHLVAGEHWRRLLTHWGVSYSSTRLAWLSFGCGRRTAQHKWPGWCSPATLRYFIPAQLWGPLLRMRAFS